MLIFRGGAWIEVELPECIDPSWSLSQRTHLAHLLASGMSFVDAEELVWGA